MESNYRLVPIVRTPQINPGGTGRLDIFFSGVGKPERNKLVISISNPELIEEEDPGQIFGALGWGKTAGGKQVPLVTHGPKEEATYPIDPTGTTHVLNQGYFADVEEYNPERVESSERGYSSKLSEWNHGELAPLTIEFNFSEDAEPGDYSIYLVFTYGDEEETKIDQKEASFHINNLREQYEPWSTRLILGSGAAAVIGIVLEVGLVSHFIETIQALLQ